MSIGIIIGLSITAIVIIFGLIIPFISLVREEGILFEKVRERPKTLRFLRITYPVLILVLSFAWIMNALLFL